MTIRLYHLLNSEFGLDNLRRRRLKISRLHELNDPFEFLGFDVSNQTTRQTLEATKADLGKKRGVLCFSKTWQNPVLWSHYADRHRGLCLGFDVSQEIFWPVAYVDDRPKMPTPPTEEAVQRLLFTKFTHWQYEQEYRAFPSIRTAEDGLYFIYFSGKLRLREVTIGAVATVTTADVLAALGQHTKDVTIFRARPADSAFSIERTAVTVD